MANVPGAAVLSDLVALGGAGAQIVEFGRARGDGSEEGVVRIGVHREGPLPAMDLDAFDILLTGNPAARRPWVTTPLVDDSVARLQERITASPVASSVAAQVLRASGRLAFDEALVQESLAYSMLLASSEFQGWRERYPRRERRDDGNLRVLSARNPGHLEIRLNRPEASNAFDARMRDELFEALSYARDTAEVESVALCGNGPSFSAGGDLDEFGRAEDVGIAHLIRHLRSPARLLHALGSRATAHLHGACIGAGIEVPAAAAHVIARDGSFFRLPEVSMGLIPGAGGTVTIPRRIGRHRACYMAISGDDIDLATALAWGLVDAREPA